MKASKGDLLGGGDIVKVDVLVSLFVRICVVQYPLVAWQVAAMSVLSHNCLADSLDLVCAVFVKIEGAAVRRMPGPGENTTIVSPDKV